MFYYCFSDFLPTLRSLLGNPVYFLYLCVTIIQFNSLIGMVTYKPKYIEQHYGQSAFKANFLMGKLSSSKCICAKIYHICAAVTSEFNVMWCFDWIWGGDFINVFQILVFGSDIKSRGLYSSDKSQYDTDHYCIWKRMKSKNNISTQHMQTLETVVHFRKWH